MGEYHKFWWSAGVNYIYCKNLLDEIKYICVGLQLVTVNGHFGIDAVQRTGIVVNISVSIGSATS